MEMRIYHIDGSMSVIMEEPMLRHTRRALLRSAGVIAVGIGLASCAEAAARPVPMVVRRNPGCGCCEVWTEQMRASGRFNVATEDDPDLATLKASRGIPRDLVSCHTALVGDYVIEGHVPLADIVRLLDEQPAIAGMAVGGMPLGSPGMEQPGGGNEAFDVVAFTSEGERRVFSHHPAR